MAEDPLAKWRQPGYQPRQETPAGSPTRALLEYKAFGEVPSPSRLWLRYPLGDPDRGVPYGYLTNVLTDNWSIIGLTFSIPFPGPLVVNIHGECLEPLAAAIMSGSAAWVQVFDAAKFIAPSDGVAVVRGIAVNEPVPAKSAMN